MEKILKDSYDRKIDYLRLSVTDRCNLRCTYCMPEKGIRLAGREEVLTYEELLKVVDILAQLGIRKLRITGGEPLLRDNILGLISGISRIEGIEKISITTNGILLSKYLEGLRQAGISGINISMDSLDPVKYSKITRGGQLYKVITALERALDMGFESIKINSVLGSFLGTGDIRDFIKWSIEKKIDIRFIEMMPVALLEEVECTSKNILKTRTHESIPADTIFDVMKEFGEIESLKDKKGYGPAVYFKIKGAKGAIGLIRNQEESCFYCNRIRITPLGLLKLCLFSDNGLDLTRSIRHGVSEKNIKDDIIMFVNKKPKSRNSNNTGCSPEDKKKIPDLMNRIGG
ncbi:MAG: GTP 3',8-cyclase MoaA [Actinomycetia bacterium]|nr:GTP 3',8-cyclase MoaA [Actinomycetes bacterium]